MEWFSPLHKTQFLVVQVYLIKIRSDKEVAEKEGDKKRVKTSLQCHANVMNLFLENGRVISRATSAAPNMNCVKEKYTSKRLKQTYISNQHFDSTMSKCSQDIEELATLSVTTSTKTGYIGTLKH